MTISWNILSAVVVFPVALLIIGWCFHFHTFWVTPLIGTALFGYASIMTIGPVVTYIVDSLPGRGATGVALNNLVRQSLATIAVFVTDPAINGMGVGPLYSLLAGLVVLAALSLVLLNDSHLRFESHPNKQLNPDIAPDIAPYVFQRAET